MLEFKPTGKLHDADMPFQDFQIVLNNAVQSKYDFCMLEVNGVLLKFDMHQDGTVRVLPMNDKLKIIVHPMKGNEVLPTVFKVVKEAQ